jgi:hypothetical protein
MAERRLDEDHKFLRWHWNKKRGGRLTVSHESGQAAHGGELSPAQIFSKLAAGGVQFGLVLPQVFSVKSDFPEVTADFLPVSKDFFFAGSGADVPAQLCSVLSQLRVILA